MLSRVRYASVGFGVTVLAVAVVLGLYGSLIATGPNCLGECDFRVVQIFLWVFTATAATLLGWVLIALRRSGGSALGVVGTSVAIIGLLAAGLEQPVSFRLGYGNEPLSPQQPLFAVVYWLTIAGAVAVAAGSGAAGRRGGRRPTALRVGSAVGLVVAVGVAGGTWWSALGSHGLDATTATAVDVPEVPQVLGERAFRVPVGVLGARETSESLHLYGAGAGFMLWQENRNDITAYDSAGVERWHYRRTGPSGLRIAAVQTYDAASAVVVALKTRNPGGRSEELSVFVGLDAVTGGQLWSATGPVLSDAYYAATYGEQSPFLVSRGREVWTAFDPRTGGQLWQVPSPTPCGYVRVADTASTVVGIEQCGADDERTSTIRVVALDPASGEMKFAKDLLTRQDVSSDSTARPAGRDGSAVSVSWGTPNYSSGPYQSPQAQLYIDGDTGAVTDFGDAGIEASRWPVGDFIVSTRMGPREYQQALHGADGARTCTLPTGFTTGGRWDKDRAETVWLGRQLITKTRDRDAALQAVDRATCQIAATRPLAGEFVMALAAAPGVLAALVYDDGRLFAEGYAP
jgi:outer membrane protein assembly factor BamB